ncbi:MAG: response regulator [Anaerolinea sp.]|nr:response regulator [Anaerolinea sp.]
MPVALIIDDDDVTHALYRHLLSRAGIDSVSAMNGVEGVASAQAAPPDCIIMNIHMPMMDGLTACQQLKNDARTADVPIIICSAAMEACESEFLERSKADAVLTKPIQLGTFIDTVKRLLRNSA